MRTWRSASSLGKSFGNTSISTLNCFVTAYSMFSFSCLYPWRKPIESGPYCCCSTAALMLIAPVASGCCTYWSAPDAISSMNISISSIRVMSFCTSAMSCCKTAVLTPSALFSLSMMPAYSLRISRSITPFTVLISSSLWSSLTIWPMS